jgi:WD40 repeat protein
VQARVFSLELGQQAFHFIANGWAWRPDGRQLATFSNNTPTVSLLSGDTGVTQMTLRGHSAALTHLAWSPDGRCLAGSGDSTDTTVRVWDTRTGELAASLPGHVLAVRALVWSPDGRRLATVSWDSVMLVWAIADGNRLLLTAYNATGEPVWSHDSRYVAVGSDLTQLRIWNIDTGQYQVASDGHQGVVWDTAWSANDRLVVSQSGDMSNDIFYAIDIWDLSIHKLVSAREPIGYAVLSTGWNSRSGLVVMLREDFSTLQVWTERTPVWRKLFEVDSSSAAYGVLSPNGRWVAIGTQAGKANQINLYDTESGSLTTHQVDGEAAMGWLLWTPDSAKLFGVDGRGKVIVWAVQEQ